MAIYSLNGNIAVGEKTSRFLNLSRRSGQIPVVEPVRLNLTGKFRSWNRYKPEPNRNSILEDFRSTSVPEPVVTGIVSVPEPVEPVSRPKLADRKNGLTKTVISFASGLRF